MKSRFRILIGAIEVLLLLAGVYFEPTFVVRGTFRGETFYEGRPTSYWRARCDEWLNRFDTPEEAIRWIPDGIALPTIDGVGFGAGDALSIRMRPQTFWTSLIDRFRSAEDRFHDDWPPQVLFGFTGAEPVLEELAREPKYEAIAKRGLAYAKVWRKMGITQ